MKACDKGDATRRLVDHSEIIAFNPIEEEDALALLEKKLGKLADKKHIAELERAAACIRQKSNELDDDSDNGNDSGENN